MIQGQDHLSAFQVRIKKAEDSIADLKDNNVALQEKVILNHTDLILIIVNNSIQSIFISKCKLHSFMLSTKA